MLSDHWNLFEVSQSDAGMSCFGTIVMFSSLCLQWPLLLTWFDFSHSMNKELGAQKVWDEITYPFLNFNGCTVEV